MYMILLIKFINWNETKHIDVKVVIDTSKKLWAAKERARVCRPDGTARTHDACSPSSLKHPSARIHTEIPSGRIDFYQLPSYTRAHTTYTKQFDWFPRVSYMQQQKRARTPGD